MTSYLRSNKYHVNMEGIMPRKTKNLSIKTGLSRSTFKYAKDNDTENRIIPFVRSSKRKTIEEL